ncbi:MAG: M15 family metallopeptidase, partial [Firmicutes bacterium]|nr:M15 family metallopeptidase [Bacillota bacterium]
EEAANRFSARPGQSEHQLGTTVDFGGTSADWTTGFANTKQGKWLLNNAHLYGFALSYPEGKESVTGYIYEPWHFRYIGVAVAKEWKESGLVLCEFLKTKPQYFDN